MDLMQGRARRDIEWSDTHARVVQTPPLQNPAVKHLWIQREDLSNLPFTSMCISESLRLHPPVQAVTRKYTQDMPLPGNLTVPQGQVLIETDESETAGHLWEIYVALQITRIFCNQISILGKLVFGKII